MAPVDRSARLAAGVFGAYLAVAWFVLIYGFGADRWFHRDDWFFLAARDAGSLEGLFAPHGEHLTVLPVLAFRTLFRVFGLEFTPYLTLVVTMHLGVVAMVRVVLRRSGVGPWLATVAAGTLVLFGPGEQNIQWAFQIGFVGSMFFGLIQLVLADHDGPFDRRDVLGLLAGAAAVGSSGVGPVMVGVVGLTTLVTRGWRVAAFHTAPLGALYVLWYVTMDPRQVGHYGRPSVGVMFDWIRGGLAATFEGLGHVAPVGLLLAALMVAGLACWLVDSPAAELRRRMAPLSLLVAAPLFFVLTAQARWAFGPELIRSSRYVYVGAVLIVPALALAAQAITTRWRFALPLLVVLLLVGVPGNIAAFGSSPFGPAYFANQRQTILGLAHDERTQAAPGWIQPMPDRFAGPGLTVGWLREVHRQGLVPEPGAIDPDVESVFPLRLGLVHAREPNRSLDACEVEDEPVELDLARGEEIRIVTPVAVELRHEDGSRSRRLRYHPADGSGTLVVVADELPLRFAPTPGSPSFEWCR